MNARIDYQRIGTKRIQPLLALQAEIKRSGLDQTLLRLVEMRASQINGCAYCLDMHSKDARANGESEQRLYGLDAWREAPYYSARERAALAWTEAVTRVADTHVPDEAFAEAHKQFSDEELVDLTLAIVAINSWNRLMVAFRIPAGTYEPQKKTQLRAGSHPV
jgi:AhpD family alkylhydroperoxidase